MTCVSKNIAFASHYLQYEEVEGGLFPLVNHKFFITDLPYGLCTYKDIALSLGIATPTIDAIIYWNQVRWFSNAINFSNSLIYLLM